MSLPTQAVIRNGLPTRVDLHEIRAKAQEQSVRLFERLNR